MMKFITPIVLIGLAIAGFILLVQPIYSDIGSLQEQAASYGEALDNSKKLENERDKLTQKYNAIDPENLAKLEKLLPDSVDNIRLILEIEKIAAPYGMSLRDVKYEILKKTDKDAEEDPYQTGVQSGENKEYGSWNLSFSVQAVYGNFINFIKDLERNLRIVDISSIQFSSSAESGINPGFTEAYKYIITIKTYWLKN